MKYVYLFILFILLTLVFQPQIDRLYLAVRHGQHTGSTTYEVHDNQIVTVERR